MPDPITAARRVRHFLKYVVIAMKQKFFRIVIRAGNALLRFGGAK